MYKSFDIDSWERKDAYHFYKGFSDPCFSICADIDISRIKCRADNEEGFSLFLASIYYAVLAANNILNFRLRILEDRVVEHSEVYGGSTILFENKTFGFAYFDNRPDIDSFLSSGRTNISNLKRKEVFNPGHEGNDIIYFSSIPWVSFTSFKHAQDKSADKSIPKIVFGKYFTKGNKTFMPVSVEVNHALMDGYHLGLWFDMFAKYVCKK